MSERLTDAELSEIERYLGEGGGEERTGRWLRLLLAEARAHRGTHGVESAPLKQECDALMHGSGTRHGEHRAR